MPEFYYKATRTDGTDFRTGTMKYEVGAVLTHPSTTDDVSMRPNRPSTYISTSAEPAETLIGGRWPCRLFRVQPLSAVVSRTDGNHPHKRGVWQLRVVEELPAWRALGPNGEAVATIITRARALTGEEAQRLRAARYAARGAARYAAMDAARAAARATARAAARDAVWDAARAAARGAALAELVRDSITVEQYNLLIGPWRSVVAD